MYVCMHSGSDAGMVGDNDQPIRKHAPQWCVRRCGATFGFGGVLIKFSTAAPAVIGAPAGAKPAATFNPEVTLCEYVSDKALVYKAHAFQSEMQKANAKVRQVASCVCVCVSMYACMYVCMYVCM
jgi:hypothetical protein